MNMPELGPALPTVCTGGELEAVESGCRECKSQSNAGLMRVAKNPGLHMASIAVHPHLGFVSGAFTQTSSWRSSEKVSPVTRPSGPLSNVMRVVLPLG